MSIAETATKKQVRDYIGSAHIAGILGVPGAFGSQYSIAQELRTGQGEFDEDNLPEAVALGLQLEDWILQLYCKKTGATIVQKQAHFRYPGWDCAGATPDALVRMPNGRLRVVDAKVPGDFSWSSVPEKYVVSSRWQVGITAANVEVEPACDLAVFHASARRLRIYTVEHDSEWFGQALDHSIEWFRRYVIEGEIPPIDGSSYTSDALKRIDAEIGKVASLDHLTDVIRMHARYDRIATWAEKKAREAENTLCASLGDAEIGLVEGMPAFTWKQQQGRVSVDQAALQADHPEIFETYSKRGKPFRVPRFVKPRKGGGK